MVIEELPGCADGGSEAFGRWSVLIFASTWQPVLPGYPI